jgi:hypothetical protein
MAPNHIAPKDQLASFNLITEKPEDFLSPEQRLKAIADILGAIAIRVVRKQHEHNKPKQQ